MANSFVPEIRQYERTQPKTLCSVARALTPRPTSQARRSVSSSPTNVIPDREVARTRMGNGNMKGQEGGGNLFIVAYFYICYTGHFLWR